MGGTIRDRVAPLDGLRAVAALLVLANHTSLAPAFAGTLGVLLFFTLSAFLLTRPFLEPHGEVYSIRGVLGFYTRRVFRIIPMLVVYVFAYGFFIGGGQFIIDSLVYVRGYGHLWTITQEMLFYVLMPGFALLVLPFNPLTAAAILIVVAWLADSRLIGGVMLPGMTGYVPFFLAPFLAGMAAAYVAPKAKKILDRTQIGPLACGLVSLTLVVTLFHWPTIGLGCAALLLWIVAAPQNWLTSVLSAAPLRIIGIVGYSFYLWHWVPVHLMPLTWSPLLRFAVALIVTLLASLVTFAAIERPAIRLGALVSVRLCQPRPLSHAPRAS